eukprot:14478714-Alexandrium_andersonii.AAC.1
MSASLVGSEMCIRDRTSVVQIGTIPCVPWGAAASAESPELLLPTLDPVSYTHLTLPTICSV